LLALGGAVAAQVVSLRRGAFDAPGGSVYSGRSVTLPLQLLVAPIVGWLAGTMLITHLLQAATAGVSRVRRARRFSAALRGVLWRSLTRRLRALSAGVVAVALVVGLGTMLACFATAWDHAEADDSRFTVGSDVRLTPNPTSGYTHPTGLAATFTGPASTAAAVVYAPQNAAVVGPEADDVASMAAVDPDRYPRVAPLPDAVFVGTSAQAAMAALAAHPDGVLLNVDAATSLQLRVGDAARLVLARDTDQQTERPTTVLGLFKRFPGAPAATDVVANLDYYQRTTGLHEADYFLLRAPDATPAGIAATVHSVDGMPDFVRRFDVTTATANLDKDRSSLTALNVRGLLRLDSLFTFLMAATATAMFVFGLLMQRRREYVTMRAQGLHRREVRLLVLAESGVSAVLGAGIGVGVGIAASGEFVRVLRPIFLLPPRLQAPVWQLGTLVGLLLAATVLAGAAAAVGVNRLQPTELLRDE
jgi:putative ABC transport system permease protein